MQKILLKHLQHRGQQCIGIYYDHNAKLNGAIRSKAGARWSNTQKVWWVLLTKENYTKIFNAVKGLAVIDHTELSKYLIAKKKSKDSTAMLKELKDEKVPLPIKQTTTQPDWVNKATVLYKSQPIASINSNVLPAMRQHLKLKAYSASTIKTYINEIGQLLQLLGNIPVDALTPEHLKRYLVHCYEKLGVKENTLHSRINALKFYYEQVLGREKFFWEIPRPKRPVQLPKLLNETELRKLFNALLNKKHKAMLFTAYSAGLRVSEIVKLKIRDIDSKRMQIFIERAKGKKDRYVNLSPLLLDILRNYILVYKPKPQFFLFESEQTLTAYPTRTVQQIFTQARLKAGIKKEVGVHSLRHSFATHLLDKGTDIKYIKDLLGHFNIKTTERYLHVSKKQLVNIISPFDDLMKGGGIDW